MLIRKAKISDARYIVKLFDELREYELSLLDKGIRQMQLNWEIKKNVKDIKGILKSKNNALFVADKNGKIVGFISNEICKGAMHKEGDLGHAYLKKDYRGKGIGKLLIKESLKWFNNNGCKSVSLNVYSANKKARQIYKKWGFKLIAENYKKRL